VQSANAGIQDPDRRAVLAKFDLNAGDSGLVTDGTYGDAVNNRLERRVYDVSIRGSFPQVVSIIRSIERLQPLLVVSNLNSQLDPATQRLVLDNQGRVAAQPETRIITTFQLAALVPTEQATAPEAATSEVSPSPAQ
jgi:type IV pilus assembly protein PilO